MCLHSMSAFHLLAFASLLASCALADPQLDALNAFYQATGGTNWKNNTGWGSNQDPCGRQSGNSVWSGLSCSGGWVVEIKLHNNGVGGTLPPSLANLDYLQKLDLSNNLLIGSIPNNLVNAPSITDLNLAYNRLQGSIPPFGQNNTGITNLYLGNNKLQGTIPTSIFNLQTLQELDLSSNGLTGTVSSKFAGLSLTSLWINNNDFSGNLPLSLCQSLLICSGAFNLHLMCASMSCTCGAMQSCNCNNLCQHDSDCLGLCTSCVGATPYLNGYCQGSSDQMIIRHY